MVCIVVGDGVYQQAMNFCVDLLNEGKWIHIFPEGECCLVCDIMYLQSIGITVHNLHVTQKVLFHFCEVFYHYMQAKLI